MKTHSTMLKDLHGGMHTLHIVFKVGPSERRVSVLRSPGPGDLYLTPTHYPASLSWASG